MHPVLPEFRSDRSPAKHGDYRHAGVVRKPRTSGGQRRAEGGDMSRKSSRHIRRLEDAIRHAILILNTTPEHPYVRSIGTHFCQCPPCRARRVLLCTTLRTPPTPEAP